MKEIKSKCASNVQLDSSVSKIIYQHASLLAKGKYKTAIDTLKSRHRCYDAEDFIQDSVKNVLESFNTKKFPTIFHLKSFINSSMNFHYLKEKRKHFSTKQRGSFNECSIDDCLNDDFNVGSTISLQKDIDTDVFDLYNIQNKNLFVIYDWKKPIVCSCKELRNYKTGYAISVNYFIKIQTELGLLDTCRHYKSKGFYMTKNIFNEISQAIIDYAKEHNYLIVDND